MKTTAWKGKTPTASPRLAATCVAVTQTPSLAHPELPDYETTLGLDQTRLAPASSSKRCQQRKTRAFRLSCRLPRAGFLQAREGCADFTDLSYLFVREPRKRFSWSSSARTSS